MTQLENKDKGVTNAQQLHRNPIAALHCPDSFSENDNLVHCFMTGAQDGMVKIWDRRSNVSVAKVTSLGQGPFYSVGTNANMIAAGTNQDTLIWDIHKLGKPFAKFEEGHMEDITAIKFCPDTPNLMISCSIDNVLNMFDFKNHDLINASKDNMLIEEDIIDGAYSSMQPLIDCGFVTPEIIWTVTSINTVEFIRTMDAVMFLTLTQVSLIILIAKLTVYCKYSSLMMSQP